MNAGGIKLWRRRMRAAIRGSHPGQAVAEFALVITPCLTLFFGVINFALALYSYDFVCYSAQQAVRYATVRDSTATTVASSPDVNNYVNPLVVGVARPSATPATRTWVPCNRRGGLGVTQVG